MFWVNVNNQSVSSILDNLFAVILYHCMGLLINSFWAKYADRMLVSAPESDHLSCAGFGHPGRRRQAWLLLYV